MTGLRREQAVVCAARQILLEQLALFEINRTVWSETQAPKSLHDLRVAVRRARTLLTELKNDLPPTAEFRAELVQLGIITGPVRDLDVLLVSLAAPQGPLAAVADKAARVLRPQLLAERQQAVSLLQRELRVETSEQATLRWRSLLDTWSVEQSREVPPLGVVADRRVGMNLRKMLDKGASLNDSSGSERYHRLRIRGKKLRYLLEFFATLYPTELILPITEELKKLQDNLGQFQDDAVLRRWLQKLRGGLTPEQYQLFEDQLTVRQQAWQKAFFRCFDEFSSSRSCQQLQHLLGC